MLKSTLLILLALFVICVSKSFDSTSESTRYKRNAVSDVTNKFANGKVQYYIDDKPPAPYLVLGTEQEKKFKKAMQFLSNNTCLVFESKPTERGRMQIVQQNTSSFCAYQNVGNYAAWNNLVRLSSNNTCSTSIPLLVRMIMHQIGFYAMSARPDVDTYMSVNGGIIKNTLQFDAMHNVNKMFPNVFISRMPPFEFGSILTYGPSEFTLDESKPVFTAKAPYELFQYSMGSERVTFGDIRMINNFYCSSTCATSTLKCGNKGYPNPANCSQCLCPEGFAGPACADLPTGFVRNRTQGFIYNATSTWQRRFIEFGQDTSLPIREEPTNRVDWIVAPTGQKIEVMLGDIFAQCNPGCKTAGVEVKFQDVTLAGVRLCCMEHVNKTITSTLNPTPIISYNRYSWTTFWIKYRAVPP